MATGAETQLEITPDQVAEALGWQQVTSESIAWWGVKDRHGKYDRKFMVANFDPMHFASQCFQLMKEIEQRGWQVEIKSTNEFSRYDITVSRDGQTSFAALRSGIAEGLCRIILTMFRQGETSAFAPLPRSMPLIQDVHCIVRVLWAEFHKEFPFPDEMPQAERERMDAEQHTDRGRVGLVMSLMKNHQLDFYLGARLIYELGRQSLERD